MLTVKTEGRLTVNLSYCKDALIAVVIYFIAAYYLICLNTLLSYMFEAGIDLLKLKGKLLLIAHMHKVAAAAFSEIRTCGGYALRGRGNYTLCLCVDCCFAAFKNKI